MGAYYQPVNEIQKPLANVAEAETLQATVPTSFTVPEVLWKRVRNLATDRRVSAQSLWLEAMAAYLEESEAA